MNSKFVGKKFKKNKYRIGLTAGFLILAFLLIAYLVNHSKEKEIAKYDNEIFIVKGNGNQLSSLTLKELRHMGSVTETIHVNNGLESKKIEGVSIEKIIGNLNYNLKDSNIMMVEDNDGNFKKISMADVLEPDRIYLVYMIDGTPIYDILNSYGIFMIIDTASDNTESWITNVKTIDIQ